MPKTMLDVTKKEGRLSIEQVAAETGKSVSAVREWMRPVKAMPTKKGEPKEYVQKEFYLESAMLGGVRYTNHDELQRFQQKCTEKANRGRVRARPPVPTGTGTETEAYWRNRLRQDHGVKV